MRRFPLELVYYFTYFSTVVPPNIRVFLSCRPFVVNITFLTGLVGVEVTSVSWLGQLTVQNVVLTTKGLQERNMQMLDGTTVENKGKTIN